MPRITRPFDPEIGPLVSVTVSDPFSARAEFESPRSEIVNLLIDPGSFDQNVNLAII